MKSIKEVLDLFENIKNRPYVIKVEVEQDRMCFPERSAQIYIDDSKLKGNDLEELKLELVSQNYYGWSIIVY